METVETTARPSPLRRLYNWMLSWAEHPQAGTALFLLAAAEASFFPIPPDVLLMALAISQPRRAFRFATVCLAGSVIGGLIGYGLGYGFMASIGQKILALYHLGAKYDTVAQLYRQYDAWAVAAGGFTPLPYKLFTITAGAFKIDLLTFTMASILSRAGRFFLIAAMFYLFGPPVKRILDRYLGLFTVAFMILLIGGFFVIKWMF